MLALVALLQLQAATIAPPPEDSLPIVTLGEALRRATGLDPNYVAAVGQVDNARGARRSAFGGFLAPSLGVETDATKNIPKFFNFGTLQPESYAVSAQAVLRYDVFTGGQKFAELTRSAAALDGAHAGEILARFGSALLTEATYYSVLAGSELLGGARARVTAGAAVQSDSLQLRLELSRARVALVQQVAAVRVARLTLGSRVGAAGPVDAAPLDSVLPSALPMTLEAAVDEATSQGPAYRLARANERQAAATYRSRLGTLLPRLSLSGVGIAYDNRFYPTSAKFTQLTLTATLPIWDNFQRQTLISQARVSRDVFRAARDSAERSVRRDLVAAYEGYTTARATVDLAAEQVQVARENYRVQQARYRTGATTILDLLKAQSDLDDADAAFVQARYAARLALAGLETVLGRRLFTEPQQK